MSGFTIQNGEVVQIGIWAGDVIIASNGERMRVDKVAQVNYKCTDEKGGKWNVRITPNIKKADDQTWNGPKEKNPYEIAMEAVDAGIVIGSAVSFKNVAQARKYPGTYIVCSSVNAAGKVRLAKLGGEGGKYFSGYPVNQLEKVDI